MVESYPKESPWGGKIGGGPHQTNCRLKKKKRGGHRPIATNRERFQKKLVKKHPKRLEGKGI